MNQKVKEYLSDVVTFAWLMLGILFFGIIGLFMPKTGPRSKERLKRVFEWTSNYIAPASEKALDMEIASQLVDKYFPGGKTLDVAFGAGRFEEDALSAVIKKGSIVDGIDLELERDSSIDTMRRRPWVREVWKRSYCATGLPSQSYSFIFCNNGLMATENLWDAFKEIGRIAEDDAIFIFNMVSRNACSYTYKFFIALNYLLCRPRKAMEWKEKAVSRLESYYDQVEIRDMLEKSGWTVDKVYPYLSGAYMYWHYIFNFPAYTNFFRHETSETAPFYYNVMKAMWRRPLEKVILMHAKNASRAASGDRSAKYYLVARRKKSRVPQAVKNVQELSR